MILSHPGKLGDLIWSLATARDLLKPGEKATLKLSPYCWPLQPLLEAQSWIEKVEILEDWQVRWDAPPTPWKAPSDIDVHLGMREWPFPTLAEYYPWMVKREYGLNPSPPFHKPWLYLGNGTRDEVLVSWSDEYAESKAGTLLHVAGRFPLTRFRLATRRGSRIMNDFRFPLKNVHVEECGLLRLGNLIAGAKLVLTCNSLGHPLSVALGTPAVIYEPQVMRHQKVFKAPGGCKVTYVDSVNSYEVVSALEGMGLK